MKELPPWPKGVDTRKLVECNCAYCHMLVEIYLRGTASECEIEAETGQTTLTEVVG